MTIMNSSDTGIPFENSDQLHPDQPTDLRTGSLQTAEETPGIQASSSEAGQPAPDRPSSDPKGSKPLPLFPQSAATKGAALALLGATMLPASPASAQDDFVEHAFDEPARPPSAVEKTAPEHEPFSPPVMPADWIWQYTALLGALVAGGLIGRKFKGKSREGGHQIPETDTRGIVDRLLREQTACLANLTEIPVEELTEIFDADGNLEPQDLHELIQNHIRIRDGKTDNASILGRVAQNQSSLLRNLQGLLENLAERNILPPLDSDQEFPLKISYGGQNDQRDSFIHIFPNANDLLRELYLLAQGALSLSDNDEFLEYADYQFPRKGEDVYNVRDYMKRVYSLLGNEFSSLDETPKPLSDELRAQFIEKMRYYYRQILNLYPTGNGRNRIKSSMDAYLRDELRDYSETISFEDITA